MTKKWSFCLKKGDCSYLCIFIYSCIISLSMYELYLQIPKVKFQAFASHFGKKLSFVSQTRLLYIKNVWVVVYILLSMLRYVCIYSCVQFLCDTGCLVMYAILPNRVKTNCVVVKKIWFLWGGLLCCYLSWIRVYIYI